MMPRTNEPRVQFSTVEVNVHKQVLGSNPAVRKGLPVELSWRPTVQKQYSVDDYEKLSALDNKKGTKVRALTAAQREELLERNGHSRSSFMRTRKEIYAIKKEAQASRKKEEVRQNKKQSQKKQRFGFLSWSVSKLQRRKQFSEC